MKHALPNKVELPTGKYAHLRVERRSTPTFCALCGNSGLSIAHIVRHARIGEIQVGGVCAGRLIGNSLLAEVAERAFRFREVRRKRWLERPWRQTKSGVSFITADGFSLIVYPVKDGYSGLIVSLVDDTKLVGRRVFASLKEAQETAIRVLCHSWLDPEAKR